MIEIRDFIKGCFLFKGLSDEELDSIIESDSFTTAKYGRGETIYSPETYEHKLGFIISGECEIRQLSSDGSKVILNTLRSGDSFGILSIFREDEFPTDIHARRNTEILFISKESLEWMLERSHKVSLNVMRFLADKVAFLNGKIETVTQVSVEKKLGSYLMAKSKLLGKSTFSLNLKKCAESIGVGRASVYRAINSLKSKGYIAAECKSVNIISKENLEEFLK